jgi:HEAT repeat protein
VATPAILRLAKEGVPPIRSAALQTLAKLGDATQVPTLLDAAADSDASVAQAAVAALANLRGPDVDAALLAALGKAEAQRRRVTIAVLGQRRVATATAALLQAAQDPDQATRAAALKALGETATAADVAALVDLLVKAKDAQDRGAAEPALATVCQRLPDKDAAAEKLVAVLSQASSETKVALVRVLGQISGGKALAAVQQAVRDGNETVRDTAVRILGDWQDLAAAEALLNLAKNTDSKKYKILALRGYIRLIGQHPAADQKLAMCQTALGLAERDDERKLVLGVLGGVPTAEALALVLPHLDNAAMKNEASAAAVAIGDKLAASRAAPVAEAMKKVLQVTDNDDLKKRAQTVLQRAEKK